MKKNIALVLSLLLILPVAVSCTDPQATASLALPWLQTTEETAELKDTAPEQTEEASVTTEEAPAPSGLPSSAPGTTSAGTTVSSTPGAPSASTAAQAGTSTAATGTEGSTVIPRPTAKPTAAVKPTAKPTGTAKPTVSAKPTAAKSTAKPTAKPTVTARPTATAKPTAKPTAAVKPTVKPTAKPTVTVKPTVTAKPTAKPTTTAKPTKPETTAAFQLQGLKTLKSKANSAALVAAYETIAAGVERSESKISLENASHPLPKSDLSLVWNCYQNDYPQHFWVKNGYSYSYRDGSGVISLTPTYLFSGSQLSDAKKKWNDATSQVLSLLKSGMTQFEQELTIHDALVSGCTYRDGTYAHTAYGALVEGKAVCEGYAKAFQYLMQKTGINTVFVTGTSKEEAHAWNAVNIANQWYYIDVTWDDPVVSGSSKEYRHYGYFNLTAAEMNRDHTPADNPHIPLPSATSTKYQYYAHYGRRVDSFDLAQFSAWVKESKTVRLYVAGDVAAYTAAVNSNLNAIFAAAGPDVKMLQSITLGHELIYDFIS